MSWEGGNEEGNMKSQRLWMWPCRDALWDAGLWYQGGIFGEFWGVRVLVLLFSWCWCTWLPPAARQSTAQPGQNSHKLLVTPQNPRGLGLSSLL